jgi:hypothetical protein
MPPARMKYHLRLQAHASPMTKPAQRTTANITTFTAYFRGADAPAIPENLGSHSRTLAHENAASVGAPIAKSDRSPLNQAPAERGYAVAVPR